MEIKRRPGQESEVFPQEELAQEAEIRYDPQVVRESQRRYKSWSKEKLAQIQAEASRILTKLATLMDRPIEDAEVQELIRDYHKYMENYYHVKLEIFLGLAEGYVTDERFGAYFEKVAVGLADYISRAMQYYCNTEF